MPDLLTLPRRPEVANTYDDFGQPHQTASGSGSTLAGVTIGRTGKCVYIGLSERACLPLSTGSASQGEGAGEMGVAAGTLARQHNGVVRVFGRARSCNLASRQCRGSTGISQNGVSGVPLWDPVFAPLLVLPFNHSSCIYVSQDSGW
jgi:hypothetical protein